MRRLLTTAVVVTLVGIPAAAASWAAEPTVKPEVESTTTAGDGMATAVASARTGAPFYVSWLSSGPTLPIPDNSPTGVSDDIVVSDTGVIADLDVAVVIAHTWIGDLQVTLTHVETGTAVVIIDRPGRPASTFGCAGDNIDAVLDDEAIAPVETQCTAPPPAISGTFTPENLLSAFDGETLAGTWRLTVTDNASGDTGTLTGWRLDFGVYRCRGLNVTIVGTPGNDFLQGTGGPDVIIGLAGDDFINGRGGNDAICGGPGNDRLVGGPGADWIHGGMGIDTVDYSGAAGAVVVDLSTQKATGGAGTDTLLHLENVVGSGFADTITGSGGPNRILGGNGNDRLIGYGGKDRLFGQDGDDTLEGNAGDDFLVGGPGNDTAKGGAGTDTCDAEAETGCEL
ncbi:MAG: hypothetical protein FJW79_05220 [Actinobacteria bacterium]|nr:hypothetical protein [Actinomycetota bacterium]